MYVVKVSNISFSLIWFYVLLYQIRIKYDIPPPPDPPPDPSSPDPPPPDPPPENNKKSFSLFSI